MAAPAPPLDPARVARLRKLFPQWTPGTLAAYADPRLDSDQAAALEALHSTYHSVWQSYRGLSEEECADALHWIESRACTVLHALVGFGLAQERHDRFFPFALPDFN